jgi:hypothetical protein
MSYIPLEIRSPKIGRSNVTEHRRDVQGKPSFNMPQAGPVVIAVILQYLSSQVPNPDTLRGQAGELPRHHFAQTLFE